MNNDEKKFEKLIQNNMKMSLSEEAKNKFWNDFDEKFGKEKSFSLSSFLLKGIVPVAVACSLVIVFINYNRGPENIEFNELVNIPVNEHQFVIENMNAIDELDRIDEISDEEWEILLGEEQS